MRHLRHFMRVNWLTLLLTVVTLRATPTPVTTSAQERSGINVLLMGDDKASGNEIDAGIRPDSLMVLPLDPETGRCQLLAVPRDSRVDIAGIGLTKINHALSHGGMPL